MILFTLISLLIGFSDHYQIFFVFSFLPVSSLNLLLFGWIPFPSRWERMVLGRTGVLAGVSSLSRRGCWGRTEQWAMGRAQERLEVLVCVCTRV